MLHWLAVENIQMEVHDVAECWHQLPALLCHKDIATRGISCFSLCLHGIRAPIIIDSFCARKPIIKLSCHNNTLKGTKFTFTCLEVSCHGIGYRPWRQHSKVQPIRAQYLYRSGPMRVLHSNADCMESSAGLCWQALSEAEIKLWQNSPLYPAAKYNIKAVELSRDLLFAY